MMVMRRGFTLIEVLLAIALMTALLSAFFVFLRGTDTVQQAARDAAGTQLGVRTLCDMVERDLMCCLVGDAENGAGVQGSATELRMLTRAVSAALVTHGYDDRLAATDLESARFEFDESARAVAIARELPAGLRPAPSDEKTDGPAAPVANESIGPIERLRFRYFDGASWHESFDSLAQNRLPAAVEISIWLHPIVSEVEENRWLSEDTAGEMVEEASEATEFITDDRRGAMGEETGEEDEENVPPPDVVRLVIIPDAGPGGGS